MARPADQMEAPGRTRSHKERFITYAPEAAISDTRNRADFSPFATEQAIWGERCGSLKNKAVLSRHPFSNCPSIRAMVPVTGSLKRQFSSTTMKRVKLREEARAKAAWCPSTRAAFPPLRPERGPIPVPSRRRNVYGNQFMNRNAMRNIRFPGPFRMAGRPFLRLYHQHGIQSRPERIQPHSQ